MKGYCYFLKKIVFPFSDILCSLPVQRAGLPAVLPGEVPTPLGREDRRACDGLQVCL